MKRFSTPLLILSVALILFANLGFWLSRTIYNTQNFADIVVDVYKQPEVRSAISSEIVDAALSDRPLVRQVIGDQLQSVISGILASDASETILNKSASRLQTYLTSSNRQDVTVEVGQITPIVKSVATTISSDLGEQIPDVQRRTITLVRSDSLPNVNAWLRPIMIIAPLAGVAGIILLIALVYKSMDKNKMLRNIGLYLFFGIILSSLLIPYFRTILQSYITNQNADILITQTYNAFMSVMIGQLLALIVVAVIIYLVGFGMDKEKVNQMRQLFIKPKGGK